MSHVESITDELRNRVSDALLDENGLPPTGPALDVIMAVVDSTTGTDERHDPNGDSEVPTVDRYAVDAETALHGLVAGS